MSFMEPEILQKGALYSVECAKCGTTLFAHEWADEDHNERRDAMQDGTLSCDYCNGRADPSTFWASPKRNYYAGRLSAPGYLDCTDWEFETNLRRLEQSLRN